MGIGLWVLASKSSREVKRRQTFREKGGIKDVCMSWCFLTLCAVGQAAGVYFVNEENVLINRFAEMVYELGYGPSCATKSPRTDDSFVSLLPYLLTHPQ